MTGIIDAAGHATSIEYNFARRLQRIIRPDASAWRLDAIQMVGLPNLAAGVGTQSNPAPLTLLEAAQAQFRDPRDFVTTLGTDRFGYLRRVTDPLEHRTRYVRDSNGLVVRLVEPDPDGAGPLGVRSTRFTRDAKGNPTTIEFADGSALSAAYELTFSQPTRVTDPLLRTTTYAYNSTGDPTRETDPLGHSTDYAYDLHGNLTRVTDRADHATAFLYDSRGRLSDISDAEMAHTTFAYDTADNLTGLTDPLGRASTFAYDTLGRLVSVTRPLGHVSHFDYDSVHNLTISTDPLGYTTNYAYDGLHRVIAASNATGGTTAYDYDDAGNLIDVADPLARHTTYSFDALNRLSSETDVRGNTTAYAYDAVGNLIALRNARGYATGFTYDERDRLIGTSDARGGARTLVYDAAGQLLSDRDARSNRTEYLYDAAGRTIQVRDPLGHSTWFDYDHVGNRTEVTDALLHASRFAYDSVYRLTQVTDAANAVTTFGYDAAGQLLSTTDPVGRTTQYGHDALGRLTSLVTPLGYRARYTYDLRDNLTVEQELPCTTDCSQTQPITRYTHSYDPLSRLTRSEDGLGGIETWEYDAVGRIVRYVDAIGRVTACEYRDQDGTVNGGGTSSYECRVGNKPFGTKYTYDAMENLIRVRDALGHVTDHVYDELDRLTQTTDPLQGQIRYSYDAVGNLTSLTDPVGNTTTWQFDAADRIVTETNALNATRSYEYDVLNNLTRVTDRNGRVREFDYDAVNRLTEERWLQGGVGGPPARTLQFRYDAASRLTSATDPDSRYTFTYNDAQRTIVTDNLGTPSVPHVILTDSFNPRGERTSLSATVNSTADFSNSYTHDLLGRMTSVRQFGPPDVADKRVDFAYNAIGQFTDIDRFADLAGSQLVAASDLNYDEFGRLTSITHARAGGATIAQHAYTHDLLDRITAYTGPDGTSTYIYDTTSQLTVADHAAQPDESFTYDLNGNRTNTGYSTGANNRLLSDGTYTYTYDAEGNLTVKTRISDGERTEYTWDHRNRLTNVARRSAAGLLLMSAQYAYDIFDRRIAKHVDPDGSGSQSAWEEHFVYDGPHVVLVYDGSGALHDRYLYGPSIDQIVADEQRQANGFFGVYWALADRLGSVRDVVNGSGAVLKHIAYTAFGAPMAVSDGSGNPTSLIAHPASRFGFAGREYDSETGLLYVRARYYDPAIGRWAASDPIGFSAGDANLYRYVHNAPTLLSDPSGLRAALAPDDDPNAPPVDWRSIKRMRMPGYWENVKTTAKGEVNGGASALVGIVTIGFVDDVEVWEPTDQERDSFCYGGGHVGGNILVNGGFALGTGMLGCTSKMGKAMQMFDLAGNVVGASKAAHDIAKNGANLGNVAELAGSLAGAAGHLGTPVCFVAGTLVLVPPGLIPPTSLAIAAPEPSPLDIRLTAGLVIIVGIAGWYLAERQARRRQRAMQRSIDAVLEEPFSLVDRDPEGDPFGDESAWPGDDPEVIDCPPRARTSAVAMIEVQPNRATGTHAALSRESRAPRPCGSTWGQLWLAACLLVASVLSFGRSPQAPPRAGATLPTASTPAHSFKPIEQIRVGERVVADNPDVDSPAETQVDPATWRKLVLRAEEVWEDGTIDDINVETLQPPEWLRQHNVRVGARVPLPLDLVEMGLPQDLSAEVLAIEPCPPIPCGPGRVVLTTVNHLNRYVLELTVRTLSGHETSIRPTGFHKFYRASDGTWVSAEDLHTGDLLQGRNGAIFVVSTKMHPGNFRVYNFTVEGELVYNVSEFGVLVHNIKCYRNGSATDSNLTPKPRDTDGFSTFDTVEAATPPGGKAQVIDTDKLVELEAVPTGPPGHISIRPKNPSQLQEWINSRGGPTTHPLTQEIRDAIVGEVKRPKQ